jgi:hypothetical protein
LLAGVAFALLWPAAWNRGPFYTSDTRTYIRSADAAAHKLTHRTTAWSATEESPASTAAPGAALHNQGEVRSRSLAEIGRKGILLGRSPYYGLLLYSGTLAAGFWLPMLLQSAALLLAVFLSLCALKLPAWPNLVWLGLGLCLVPAAPFFASYLMPDLFAGIAVLACAVLLAADKRLARRDLLLGYLLLSAAMLFHDSCVLIAVSLFGLAVIANLFRRSWLNGRGLAVILLALVTAFAGQSLVAYGAQRATGRPPLRLPFLSARLVADGPGTNYLRATCPASHFALCDYAVEFPIYDAEFLFGAQPGRSVFETASYDERRALGQEQFRFFLAVLKYDPAGVLRASARDAAAQLADFRLVSFRYDPSTKDAIDRTFPLAVLARARAGAAYRGTMPVVALSVVLYVLVFGALAWLLFLLSGRWKKRTMSGGLKRAFGWTAAGIAINACVCGAFSAVDPRYQARVVWLIPLLALLAECEARMRSKRDSSLSN